MQLKKLMYVLPFCGLLMTATSFAAPANEQAVNPKAGLTDILPCKDASSCGAMIINALVAQPQNVACKQGAGINPLTVRSFKGAFCDPNTIIIKGNENFKKVRGLIAVYCAPNDKVGFIGSTCQRALKSEFPLDKSGKDIDSALKAIFGEEMNVTTGLVAQSACNMAKSEKFAKVTNVDAEGKKDTDYINNKIKAICNPDAK